MVNENIEELNEQNQSQEQEKGKIKELMENPLYRTIAGGAIGAGIGYALNPKNSEKLLSLTGLDEKEKSCGEAMKDKALSLKDSALNLKDSGVQESQKVAKSLKDKVTTSGNTSNDEEKTNDDEDSNNSEDTQYQSLKLENEDLQGRLQQLENKLDKFAKSKNK